MNVPTDLLLRLIAPEIDSGHNPEDFVSCIHCDAMWTDPPVPHWKTKELQVERHDPDCPVLEVQALLALPHEPLYRKVETHIMRDPDTVVGVRTAYQKVNQEDS